MTCLRGLADDLPLMTWLEKFVFPVEATITKEIIYWSTLLACLEMIHSGTTTFCDMYLFEHEVATAAKEAGMRALVGEVLYDFPSPNYGDIESGFFYTENLIQEWRNDPLISIAVEPHAPYTCSPGLYERANRLCHDYRVPLITHLSESERELHLCREHYGTTPVMHLERLEILGSHVIGDHCVCVTEEEIEVMAQRGLRVVHNPESNMKLGVGVAPVVQMLKKGIILGLGTDGCASNNNLNMFGEMDMAAKLHKVITKDTTVMDARTVLSLATVEGARALGMENLVGSLEKGKQADIIILDIHQPHLTPFYHPYSHLVYAANGSEVRTSIINGRIIMRDGIMINLDEERIMARVHEIGRNIKASVPPLD
jgi:5-methylthioadenosine/S-adenosylhomocysteine deaminase